MNLKIRVTHDEDKIVSEVSHRITHYPAGEVGLVWESLEPYISDWGMIVDIDVSIYNANDLLILLTLLDEIGREIRFYKTKTDSPVYLRNLNINYLGFSRQDKNKTIFTYIEDLENEEDGYYETGYEVIMNNLVLNLIRDSLLMNDFYGDDYPLVNILDPHNTDGTGGWWNALQPDILFPDVEPIFPDEGALKRYVGGVYPPKPYLFAKKERGDDGSIISYDIVEGNIKFDPNKDYVVFDDICDGGATFLFLAKLLTEKGHKGKLYLQVTHGLFTKGKEELLKYYDEIKTMTEM